MGCISDPDHVIHSTLPSLVYWGRGGAIKFGKNIEKLQNELDHPDKAKYHGKVEFLVVKCLMFV